MTADPRAGERSGLRASLLATAAIAAAAVWSVLRKGYQFDGFYADDQVWNALLMDRLHPGVLAGDPLVQLIGGRYHSGLFDGMVLLAPVVPLPVLSLALFLAARLLCCAAIYRLTVTLTGRAGAGVIASFLLAGASITYCGGVNLVETILTPRGFALAFAIFGLDAFLRRRVGAMTGWLAACLYVHPVTGVNVLGVVAFCGLCLPGAAPRPQLLAALGVLGVEALAFALRAGALAGGEAFVYDAAWRGIIAHTVGPWVYLFRLPPDVWWTTLWMPLLGGIALLVAPVQPLRTHALRFALAAAAALTLHAVAVDLLNLRPLLQLSPQRATLALCVVSIAAVAGWTEASLRSRDPLRRGLAVAFLAAAVLLQDPGFAVLLALALALAWRLPAAALPPLWRAALAAAIVAAIAVPLWPTLAAAFSASPSRLGPRIARLRSLGVDIDWAEVQRFIRAHSEEGEAVLAPPALSPRVFALRPSTLRLKMQSFTHLSRAFAFEFEAWLRDVGEPLQRADATAAIAIARRSGARWLVLDDRDTPPLPRDPKPAFRAGPYRAYALPRGADAREPAA